MRNEFLLDPGLVFLNHGSFGACPKVVLNRLSDWYLEGERNPVEFLGRRSASLLAAARDRLAEFVHARASDLAFVANATTAVNIVARSLALRAGDEVLGTDHEYGACVAAWRAACARSGASYRSVEVPLPFDAASWAARLLAAAGQRTRLIFASHISSPTALIFPVAELCAAARARGIATLIDGAHAPGHVDLDLDAIGADYYTGNCHKWLCAPKGTAFLHLRPEHVEAIDPLVVSWGPIAAAAPDPAFDAYTGTSTLERRLLWLGTRDIAPFLTVPAAIDFQREHDWPRRRQRCHELAVATLERVTARNGLAPIAPASAHGQMVALPVRCGDAAALQRHLFERHRIEVPVTRHGERVLVRISVQAYNEASDLAALEAALAAAGA
ncbi:MAG: aminotransferase class V-fold PLP-dependent enzyme [Burkholderiales bacterium]|nr:aminotransferase class V-fold PLP-dependent enzyme [Burkholderiales bacterium]MDE1928539.1 aminotransferase class V-fold PLP-dependent enzyme [Burkholderiales bacterium]MDE2159016.1 aminotransferase class V-fold PLP-dependent enzyme [Burkholderiales bacterium]MDE2504013.1 aminotransferase class V-fold PLP-dependent enzyme [Burkholderiales bacterium]